MAKSMRIRTDDQVVITSGKDAGKTGRVVRTDPKKRRVFVEGLNLVQAPRTGALAQADLKNAPGGRHHREGGADRRLQRDAARPKGNKPTRVGIRANSAGKRVRYAKRSGTAID